MVTAGAIATFYWERSNMPAAPVKTAFNRTLRYHMVERCRLNRRNPC
jgi:hypothetical protein